MPPVNILKFPTSSPSDTTPLQRLEKAGYSVGDVLGVVGKTEGNGCVNDFSRTLASHVWDAIIPSDAISVFSGGTEGVLSPHLTFFVRSSRPTGVKAVVGRTRKLRPWEIGTSVHAACVAETVRTMIGQGGIEPEHVKLALVKCPLLTSEKIADAKRCGESVRTTDTYASMAHSRYASAVGVDAALFGRSDEEVEADLDGGEYWSSVVSCSSGAELEDCHILVLANDDSGASDLDHRNPLLRAFGTVMRSAIDYRSVRHLLDTANSPTSPYSASSIVQVFAKAEADHTGMTAGKWRHTMLTDSDLHSTRHARAAVGGLIAGVTDDCAVYVSGGAEGQGPVGGGPCVVIVEWG